MIEHTWWGEGGADEVGAEADHEGGEEGGKQLVSEAGGGLATGGLIAENNDNISFWHGVAMCNFQLTLHCLSSPPLLITLEP